MKTGLEFEKLNEKIFNKFSLFENIGEVRHDVKLKGKDGLRQVDVLILSKVAGIDLITVVECKDHKSKISIKEIDGFHSKLLDINANKGIFVSTKGFSTKAISKAKRLGITLCTAHDALNPEWKFDLEVPVTIREILPTFLNPKMEVFLKEGMVLNKARAEINNIDILNHFKAIWNSGSLKVEINEEIQLINFEEIQKPFFTRDACGNVLDVREFKFELKLSIKWYKGFLHEFGDAQMLKNITEGQTTFFFNFDTATWYKNFERIKMPIQDNDLKTLILDFIILQPIEGIQIDNFNIDRIS